MFAIAANRIDSDTARKWAKGTRAKVLSAAEGWKVGTVRLTLEIIPEQPEEGTESEEAEVQPILGDSNPSDEFGTPEI